MSTYIYNSRNTDAGNIGYDSSVNSQFHNK